MKSLSKIGLRKTVFPNPGRSSNVLPQSMSPKATLDKANLPDSSIFLFFSRAGRIIDLLMGLFRGAVFRHGEGALKQPMKQPTETPTSTLALMGRFPSLMCRFPTLMGRFTDFVLRGRFTSWKSTGKQPIKKRGIKRLLRECFFSSLLCTSPLETVVCCQYARAPEFVDDPAFSIPVTQSHPWQDFPLSPFFSRWPSACSAFFRCFGCIFAGFPVFCRMPGFIRRFCIFYGLNTRKIGMTGFVRDGFGCNPWTPQQLVLPQIVQSPFSLPGEHAAKSPKIVNSVQTRGIVKTSGFTRGVVKVGDLTKFTVRAQTITPRTSKRQTNGGKKVREKPLVLQLPLTQKWKRSEIIFFFPN